MALPAEKLTVKQAALLAALLERPTVTEAAEAAGVPLRTARRYMADPAFGEEYRAARRTVTEHTVMRLQARSSEAAEILFTIASDTEAPASARVSAARAVIEQAFRGAELHDLTERIGEVEKVLAARGDARATAKGA